MKSIFRAWPPCVLPDYRSHVAANRRAWPRDGRFRRVLGGFLALLWSQVSCTCLQAQVWGAGPGSSPSRELHVAAAADLQPALPSLAQAYEAQTGVHITPLFGSSATLGQQIHNGSPADLFLSADCSHPQELVTANLAADPQPTPYARGVLVLWARTDSPAQPLSLASLARPGVVKIAVANDQHAPYGQAAAAAIQALHLQQAVAGKLVVGENIAQTAQFALSGNAQAGFLSLTIANSPPFRAAGSFIVLPSVYPPIRQCGIVLKRAGQQEIAVRFLHWLTSEAVQKRLPQLGLEPVH